MVWRTIVVESPARLSTRENQLRVQLGDSGDGEDPATVPLEDIATILLDHRQVSLTAPLLANLAKIDAPLIVCDEKHTPCGLLVSLGQHSRTTEILNLQINASLPFKKKCWQAVIQQKILNQHNCLYKLQRQGIEELFILRSKVTSGDTTNVEAHAARLYWPKLLGDPFRRGADDAVNGALNYGYTIFRAAVARGLVARGLHPALGLHHDSKLNGFNLADDFIEPFRPVVDEYIALTFLDLKCEFDTEVRHHLVGLVNNEILISGKSMTVLRAIEEVASSYVAAIREEDPDRLVLPIVSR